MREFNLDAAKRGAAVCLRDGSEARILCFEIVYAGHGINQEILNTRVIFEYRDVSGGIRIESFYVNESYTDTIKSRRDLMMRDDDYLERLERGEYGDHIANDSKMGNSVVKKNLITELRGNYMKTGIERIKDAMKDVNLDKMDIGSVTAIISLDILRAGIIAELIDDPDEIEEHINCLARIGAEIAAKIDAILEKKTANDAMVRDVKDIIDKFAVSADANSHGEVDVSFKFHSDLIKRLKGDDHRLGVLFNNIADHMYEYIKTELRKL